MAEALGLAPLSPKELLTFTLSDVILPTVDIYTDFALALKLVTLQIDYDSISDEVRQCYNSSDHSGLDQFNLDVNKIQSVLSPFGYAILGTILLSSICHSATWWITEQNWKSRLMTIPLLLLQLWPQYRSLRVLWLHVIRKDYIKARREKDNLESGIIYIGKYFFCRNRNHFYFTRAVIVQLIPVFFSLRKKNTVVR